MKTYLGEVNVTYYQEGDCEQGDNVSQRIDFEWVDNGTGRFFRMKTDGWSFSDLDELQPMIDKMRAMMEANDKIEDNETEEY